MKTEDIKTWAQHQRKDGHWKSKDACMKSEIDELRAALQERDVEIEQLRVQLAGCGVAAMQNTESSKAERAKREDYGWSNSYGDVCRMVDREIAQRAVMQQALDALSLAEWVSYEDSDHGEQIFCPFCRNAKMYGHFEDCQIDASISALKEQLK